jgi:site-specific DNA-methyltransferase (cytosine-N4-specific)
MKMTFATTLQHVRPGARYALVVGPNRSRLGGEEVFIDTPKLLAQAAATAGWEIEEDLKLDAYARFDMHRRNSITTETLVLLRKPTSV